MIFTRFRHAIQPRNEPNYASATLNLLAATMAILALVNNEWLLLDADIRNVTDSQSVEDAQTILPMPSNMIILKDANGAELIATPCTSIGARDFWRRMDIGGFQGQDGKLHYVFNSQDKVVVDCISPTMATLFYTLIAIGFSVSVVSSMAAFLHVVAPGGFLGWLKRNTILEMCIMLLTLLACICALYTQAEIQSLRPSDEIAIGPGMFLVTGAGLMSFLAAALSIRKWAKGARGRRLENQRITRPRALPSWRGPDRRAEDLLPIIDFEGYLDMPKETEGAQQEFIEMGDSVLQTISAKVDEQSESSNIQ